MSTIYEITTNLINLLETCEEVSEEELEKLSTEMIEKCGSYCRLFTEMDGKQELIQHEIDRLTHRKEMIEKNEQRIKDRLKTCLEAAQITELQDPDGLFTIKIQNNPAKVIIDDAHLLPADCLTIVQTEKIDKNAVKDAIKRGIFVPGAHIENTTRLVIK